MAETNRQNELTPKIDYVPAKINIENIEDIANYVDDVVARYVNVLVTEETKSDATDARKQLKDTQNEIHDARMKIKELQEQNFSDIEKRLVEMENKSKDAWRKVQDQIAELDKIAAEKEAKKREDKIKQYMIDKNADYNIDLKRLTWSQKWLKRQSFTSIFEEVDEQFETLKKADQALLVEEQSIKQIAKALDLEPDSYVAMIGTHEFTEIQALMDKANETKKARLEAERADREKKMRQLEDERQRDEAIANYEKEQAAKAPVQEPITKDADVSTDIPVSDPAPSYVEANEAPLPKTEQPEFKVKRIIVNIDSNGYKRLLRFMKLENIQYKIEDYKMEE